MKVHRVGNSLMVGIPVDLARRFKIEAGDDVEVRGDEDHIVIEPVAGLGRLFEAWNDRLDDASMEEIVAALRRDRDAH